MAECLGALKPPESGRTANFKIIIRFVILTDLFLLGSRDVDLNTIIYDIQNELLRPRMSGFRRHFPNPLEIIIEEATSMIYAN